MGSSVQSVTSTSSTTLSVQMNVTLTASDSNEITSPQMVLINSSIVPSTTVTCNIQFNLDQSNTIGVGIGVGLGLFVLGVIAVVIVIILWKKKKKDKMTNMEEDHELQPTISFDSPYTAGSKESSSSPETLFPENASGFLINYNEIAFEKKIGQGAFGNVWKAQCRSAYVAGNVFLVEITSTFN